VISRRDHRWLGDVLVAAGRLQPARLQATLASCTIEEAWTEVCAAADMAPPELAQLLSRRFELPLADLRDIDGEAATALPPEGLPRPA
jgi:hypothetical protein